MSREACRTFLRSSDQRKINANGKLGSSWGKVFMTVMLDAVNANIASDPSLAKSLNNMGLTGAEVVAYMTSTYTSLGAETNSARVQLNQE